MGQELMAPNDSNGQLNQQSNQADTIKLLTAAMNENEHNKGPEKATEATAGTGNQ